VIQIAVPPEGTFRLKGEGTPRPDSDVAAFYRIFLEFSRPGEETFDCEGTSTQIQIGDFCRICPVSLVYQTGGKGREPSTRFRSAAFTLPYPEFNDLAFRRQAFYFPPHLS
jgi:hypothetical protein